MSLSDPLIQKFCFRKYLVLMTDDKKEIKLIFETKHFLVL
jgi:hypothetical protein